MQNQINTRKLSLTDLNTVFAFSKWLKDNLTIYKQEEEIPKEHLLLFIDYILEKAKKEADDKSLWVELLVDLKNRIEVIYR